MRSYDSPPHQASQACSCIGCTFLHQDRTCTACLHLCSSASRGVDSPAEGLVNRVHPDRLGCASLVGVDQVLVTDPIRSLKCSRSGLEKTKTIANSHLQVNNKLNFCPLAQSGIVDSLPLWVLTQGREGRLFFGRPRLRIRKSFRN